ncbi:acyltransferase family protein [Luedemannella helvata]|uniref:Acyltransferase 3 domain-containing protein n=1 Tax=Luedemannella helvata TaxID=349315 RepID=A0ABN2KMG6_9ACTN
MAVGRTVADVRRALRRPVTPVAAPARSVGVDAVRVLGLLAVVAGHVYDREVRLLLYPWHVPVFFVISGYLWSPGRTLAAETQRRVRSLVLPYLTWLAVIATMLIAWHLAVGRSPAWLPPALAWGGARLGQPFSAFWFVTALLVACLLYRLAERVPWRWRGLAVGAALSAAYAVGPALKNVPLSAGVAVACVAFVFAGDALRRYRARIAAPLLVGGLLVAGGALVFTTGLSSSLNLKGAGFGTPYLGFAGAAAISAGLVLLGEALAAHLPGPVRDAIVQLASVGLVVVLTHSAVLWALREYDVPNLAFALATILPWLAGLLLARTRLAVLTVGSGPALVRLRRPARPL